MTESLSIAIPSPIAVMRSTATPPLAFLVPKPVSLVVDNKLYHPDVHTALPSPTIWSLPSSFAAPLHLSVSVLHFRQVFDSLLVCFVWTDLVLPK